MTISSPNTIDTTLIQDGQSGTITAAAIRILCDSLAGIAAAASPKTTNYTLLLTDRGTVIEMNSASGLTVSVPTNASVAYDIGTVIQVYQMGVGQVTIAAVTPGTTTVRTPASALTRTQFTTVSMRKRATDEWVLSGDLQ